MQVSLLFHARLNAFLPYPRRNVGFTHQFEGTRSIKDLVESLGVPHTEIALFIVNGGAVPATYLVRDGDDIHIHPIESAAHPGEPRFVLDVHLGRLAAYLRMLGFDTLYPQDHRDEHLAQISSDEQRILLTRDVGLLKRSIVKHGYFVRETAPWRQLAEVLRRFHLLDAVAAFSRCTQCNTPLEIVDKSDIMDKLPPNTVAFYDEFRRCPACDKVYWKGSHHARMVQFLAELQTRES